MKRLAQEYKQSLKLLNKGIEALQIHKQQLQSAPEIDYITLIEVKDQLRILNGMQKDLREITKEIEHYYDRWWWRSERYTLNSRKSRRYIYTQSTR